MYHIMRFTLLIAVVGAVGAGLSSISAGDPPNS